MNSLEQLLQSVDANRSVSSTLAAFEQVLFDKMLLNREIKDPAAVKKLLASFHKDKQSIATFEKYVETLHQTESENPFMVELETLVDEIGLSENPVALLQSVIEEERAGGLRTETTLPDTFFEPLTEPLTEQELYGLPPEPSTEIYELGIEDITNIEEYFNGERIFLDMRKSQQKLVELLRASPEEIAVKYPIPREAARWSELRMNLEMELIVDNVVSAAELNSFVGKHRMFSTMQEFVSGEINNPEPHGPAELAEMEQARLDSELATEQTRNMIREFPGETNEQLYRRMQGLAEDAPIPIRGRDQLFGLWDEARAEEEAMFDFPDGASGRTPPPQAEIDEFLADDVDIDIGLPDPPTTVPETSGKITMLSPEQGRDIFAALVDSEGASSVRGALAFTEKGVLMNKSWLTRVLERQAKSFLPGFALIQPVLSEINKFNPVLGSFTNIGMALLDFTLALPEIMDPTGLLAMTFGEITKEMSVQAQRRIENRDPTENEGKAWSGKRFGYVKTYEGGKARWSPAVIRAVEPSTDFGSRGAKLVMETGDDLIYVMNGHGKVVPEFTKPVRHNFNTDDITLKDEHYMSLEYLQNDDPLREFYLLPMDKQSSMMQDFGSEEPQFVELPIETTNMNAFEKKMANWEGALNLATDWKNDPIAKATGTSLDFWKEYETTRGLRDVGFDYNYSKYTKWTSGKGLSDEDFQNQSFLDMPENEYILNDVFFNSLKVLMQTQKLLADDAKMGQYSRASGAWTKGVKTERELTESEQTDYSQLYQGNDVPAAKTSEELSALLDGFRIIKPHRAEFLCREGPHEVLGRAGRCAERWHVRISGLCHLSPNDN